MLEEPRPASGALSRTGGFLCGFSHTLQPYIGCRFACEYCYVQGLPVHRFHAPATEWGDYVHPRTGIAALLRRELSRLSKRDQLGTVTIFMSSATDPYQAAERRWELTRACLAALVEFPPARLLVQTRSPLVERDFDLLRALGERCWLSVTLESDREEVRRALTPLCPSVEARLALLHAARRAGLQVQAAVSPCLPFSSVEQFGALLLGAAQRVVVDSFTSGDGAGGRRTAATETRLRYDSEGWGDWRDEAAPRALYAWLHARIGENAGWSQDGFAAVARLAPAQAAKPAEAAHT